MAQPFFETKIYNISNRIDGRAEEVEFFTSTKQFVEEKK